MLWQMICSLLYSIRAGGLLSNAKFFYSQSLNDLLRGHILIQGQSLQCNVWELAEEYHLFPSIGQGGLTAVMKVFEWLLPLDKDKPITTPQFVTPLRL